MKQGSSTFFEGTEKKVELIIDPELASLRSLGDEFWERVVRVVGARILSKVSNAQCDAYLLSESSLFIFDHRMVMITCGRTRLPQAVLSVLERVPADRVQMLVYERKNEIFPHRQPTSFFDDVQVLQRALPGRAFRFGNEDEHHLQLFHLDRPYAPAELDVTFEILMYGIDPRVGKDTEWAAGFREFLPGFDVDDHRFEPGGYSLNAIRDDRYLAVHVTPEKICSYASVETNHRFDDDLDRMLSRVLELFRPRSFDLILWGQGRTPRPGHRTYRLKSRVGQQLSCGFNVGFLNYYRPDEDEAGAMELPVDRDLGGARNDQWIEEDHQGILEMRYKVDRTLLSGKSEFQKIDIVETAGFGRMLFNDDIAMISERDEFVYHEMISHVPLFVHPAVERVLVIGGGDGGTVREILRHPSVRQCRLVEIDSLVVEGCKKHLPQTSAALDDPRVEVTIADGVEFVAGTGERFDLVIVDSTDPVGPAAPLFGKEFYGNVHRILTDRGIVVSQAESPFYEEACQRSMLEILDGLFRRVHLYNYVNLTYPGGLWSFSYAAKSDLCPVGDFDPGRVSGSGLSFRYYSAEVHRAAFVHPPFQQANLEPLLTPLKTETRGPGNGKPPLR